MNRREFLVGATAVASAVPVLSSRGDGHPTGPAPSAPDGFSMTVLNPDVMAGGAGQCCILRMPSGKTYFYDTANGDFRGKKRKNNGRDIIEPWLRARGIAKIDGLVISHYHADHFGGFLWLKDHVPIAKIFNNDYTPQLEGLNLHDIREYAVPHAALEAWGKDRPGCLVNGTKAGDDLGWSEPGVKVEVVWPPKEGPVKPIENRVGFSKGDGRFHHLLNGNSTALRITAGGRVLFIVGDIQADYLETYMRPYLKERGLWGGDFVVLPSHGTTPDRTAKIIADFSPAPRAVVSSLGNLPWMIDCGRDVVRTYASRGIAAYSTNLNGNVTVRVAGGRLTVANDIETLYEYGAE